MMQVYDFRQVFSELGFVARRGGQAAFFACAAAFLSAVSVPAHAADQPDDVHGIFNDWTAHSYQEPDSKVCNTWSRPIDTKPANVRRGDIYAFVTHRPGVPSRDAVSFAMGYPLRKGEAVSVQIGNKKFALVAEGEAAFPDTKDEKALVAAMRRGNRMVVRGVSTRGTRTTDTYSLSGVTAAIKAIDKACPK